MFVRFLMYHCVPSAPRVTQSNTALTETRGSTHSGTDGNKTDPGRSNPGDTTQSDEANGSYSSWLTNWPVTRLNTGHACVCRMTEAEDLLRAQGATVTAHGNMKTGRDHRSSFGLKFLHLCDGTRKINEWPSIIFIRTFPSVGSDHMTREVRLILIQDYSEALHVYCPGSHPVWSQSAGTCRGVNMLPTCHVLTRQVRYQIGLAGCYVLIKCQGGGVPTMHIRFQVEETSSKEWHHWLLRSEWMWTEPESSSAASFTGIRSLITYYQS